MALMLALLMGLPARASAFSKSANWGVGNFSDVGIPAYACKTGCGDNEKWGPGTKVNGGVSNWLSPDPLWMKQGPMGLNVYQYAYWNPVRFTDPDGRASVAVNPLRYTNKAGSLAPTQEQQRSGDTLLGAFDPRPRFESSVSGSEEAGYSVSFAVSFSPTLKVDPNNHETSDSVLETVEHELDHYSVFKESLSGLKENLERFEGTFKTRDEADLAAGRGSFAFKEHLAKTSANQASRVHGVRDTARQMAKDNSTPYPGTPSFERFKEGAAPRPWYERLGDAIRDLVP
jgi:hypothetical protein